MKRRRDPLPIGSMMPVLIGLGMLIAERRFSAMLNWPRPAKLAMLLGGTVILCWGILQIVMVLSGNKKPRSLTRHRATLPREGMAYLLIMGFLFVGALIGRSNMLMLVFAILAGPFVVNGTVTYSMLRRIGVRRELPERCMAGEVVSIHVEVENRKRLLSSWILTIRDTIENAEEEIESGAVFARVPARSMRRTAYQFRPLRRGEYFFGPVVAFTRFPFGLVERTFRMPAEGRMLVYPRIGRLTARWKRSLVSQADLLDRRQGRMGTFEDEFHRIREYRPGDNPRAIHWRSSARHRELMVREFEESRDREMAVILDLWIPDEPAPIHHVRTELAVSFTATVAVEQIRDNRLADFRLTSCGDQVSAWEAGGEGSFESLLDSFAQMKAGSADETAELLRTELQTGSPRKRIVVITTRPPEEQPRLTTADATEGAVSTIASSQVQTVFADLEGLSDFFVLD